MDAIDIFLTIVSLITVGLSLFIIRGEHNDSNKVFSLFILAIGLWAFGLLMFRVTSSLQVALDFTRFYYIMAAAIPAFFLHFSYIFPTNKKIGKLNRSLIYVPLVLISIGLIISPHFILTSVYLLNSGVKSATVNVVNYIGYTIYFVSFLIIAYTNLFRAYLGSKDLDIKIQLRSILIGTIVPYLIAMYFDLISPPFDYTHVWIGPFMAIIVVWVLLYAIYKHHLLNARVITTEMFTASLWIFLLVRTLLSDNDQDRLINLVLFLLTVVVGIFLIRNVHNEIEQREKIEKLAAGLEKANVRLTELDKQKSEFVSFATHQLRAPLTAMKGYGSMILEGDYGEVSDKVREGVKRIFDSANTLVGIVNDYLNISRIELGTMKYAFETLDLKALIEDTIAELKPNIDKSGLAFSFVAQDGGMDFRITADRDKLKQVVANLVDNAMKYTPQGWIKATLAYDRPKHRFVFAVKDNGIGIDPAVLPHLFQKFTRASNANKVNIRGTGLGLFVAKEMVEAHHGEIRAESAGEGKGSTFIVELEPFGKV